MENLKYLWLEYKKEILVLGLIVFVLFTSVSVYYINSRKTLDDTIEKVEVLEKEQSEDVVLDGNDEKREESIKENVNVQVDIKGEVKKPGVYVTTQTSRVIDIINSAGGLTKNADTSLNNLSRKVQDEMVIIIYSKKEVENFSKTKKKEETVFENLDNSQLDIKNDAALKEEDILTNQDMDKPDEIDNKTDEIDNKNDEIDNKNDSENKDNISINIATKEELMMLPGIGESKADAIIDYRTQNGFFEKIEDIMEVSGIGQSIFDKIKDYITI